MDHQPAPLSKNKKVGCGCQCGVEAGFVEHRNVLRASHPGKLSVHAHPYIGRRGPQLLTTLKDHLPAFPHPIPAGQQIPSRVNTSHPVLVRPNVIHPLEHPWFQRAVKGCVCFFDRDPGFSVHTRAKTIPPSATNSSRLRDRPRGNLTWTHQHNFAYNRAQPSGWTALSCEGGHSGQPE